MTWYHALFLGILQGITEFLPVSSTAHLSLLEYYLGLEETPRFFDVMLHLGTLAAVMVFYRENLLGFGRAILFPMRSSLIVAANGDGDKSWGTRPADLVPHARRLAFLLVLATLPAVAASLVFRPAKAVPPNDAVAASQPASWRQTVGNWRDRSSERPGLVAFFLACTGLVLIGSARISTGAIGPAQLGAWHALAIGIAQAFSATCPGLSRSGMTISTALAIGVEPAFAVHFSLLMSLPAVVGAAVLKARDLDAAWLTTPNLVATSLGVAASAWVGWWCILLLMRSVQRKRWSVYGIYVLTLAGAVAAALQFR